MERKGQGMRIRLQHPRAENSVLVYTVPSKLGVLTETLFLLLMVFGKKKTKKENQPPLNLKESPFPNNNPARNPYKYEISI